MSNDLDVLVPAWLTYREVAEQLGLPVNKVGRLVRERELIALPLGPHNAMLVPAACIADGQVLKGLQGTLTVLHDAGFDDEASVRWLFTADDSFEGTPIGALAANRGKEVRRQAQALAF
jgi:excisionase family DNA binding protein